MESKTQGHSKTLIILILAVVAGAIYLLSLFLAYPELQNTRLADPLAEINSLFPLYYIAIALAALSGVGCLIWRVDNKSLHIPLLVMFAAMLWLTPYYLAGFVRLPDGPWHVGVAMHVPEVLNGDPVAFSGYVWDYPSSFIYHYSFVSIAGIEPLTYTNLFPLIGMVLFVLLCYALIVKLFNAKVAFLSMLIAIPGLHYIQLHPSPHTISALLMLTALLLLTRRGAAAKVVAVMVVIAIIISHPTTPLLLSVFLVAALLTITIYSRRIGRTQVALATILIICFVGWFSLYTASRPAWVTTPEGTSPPTQVAGREEPSPRRKASYLYRRATRGQFEVSEEYLTGTPFIYSNIYTLNKVIYFVYAASALSGLLYIAARTYSKKRSTRDWISKLGGLKRSEALLALTIPPLLLMTFLLAEQAPDLIETGLTYIILAVSCIIASVIARSHWMNRGIARFLPIIGVLFLTLSFPVVAYSIDAYSSFPESEEVGLEFLANDIPLDGKTLAMDWATQLALYVESPLNQTKFVTAKARYLDRIQPDLVVFRSTSYYYAAMRYDLSFENNRLTDYLSFANSNNYDRVYSDSAFEVYSMDEEK